MEIPLSTDNPVPLKLVFIPPGEFSMGSPEPEVGRKPDEKLHPVRITRGFYLSVTEITQAQWEAVMHTAPWKGKPQVQEGTTLPAVCIGWEQANEFCRTLSALEKKEFRLPTEAEWEYAHRAGGKTTYSFGDDPAQLTEFAWFREEPNATTAQHKFAQPVGTKAANPFGLYDMNGNVWEWCFDHYDKKYYEASPENNPQGPTSGSFCVRRGGSWQSDPTIFRAAYRSVESPSNTNVVDLGFRLAMSVGETPSALETGSATDQEATNSGND
jgi:formylglycine-generating enzyme required for sulfatase activity